VEELEEGNSAVVATPWDSECRNDARHHRPQWSANVVWEAGTVTCRLEERESFVKMGSRKGRTLRVGFRAFFLLGLCRLFQLNSKFGSSFENAMVERQAKESHVPTLVFHVHHPVAALRGSQVCWGLARPLLPRLWSGFSMSGRQVRPRMLFRRQTVALHPPRHSISANPKD
jgi:hypothetical protein